LEFYPSRENDESDGGRRADAVLPLTQTNGQGGINEPAFLFTSTDQLATAFTLPRNIERAYLDVITQSQIDDEFWYTCVPNDLTIELQSCGNTAFREGEISNDGAPPVSRLYIRGSTGVESTRFSGSPFQEFRR